MRSFAKFFARMRGMGYLAAVMNAAAVPGIGCTSEGLPDSVALADSPVVARVAGVPIHARDVAIQMRRQAVAANTGSVNGSRNPGGGGAGAQERRRAALDQLITFEILARAAAAAGVDATPPAASPEGAVIQSLKVQRLVERDIEPRLTRDAINDGEVRAVYERAKPRFVHGRLVEVVILCLFTGARMKPEPRARAEESARKLKAFLDSQPAPLDRADFEAVSKAPLWMERKVSFTTVWQADDQPFTRAVGRAVQALTRPGAMTDVVGDETGYYIALYLGEQTPANVSFTEAAPVIRQEMYEPWRRQRFLQLALALAEGHDVEIFPENFPLLNASPAPP